MGHDDQAMLPPLMAATTKQTSTLLPWVRPGHRASIGLRLRALWTADETKEPSPCRHMLVGIGGWVNEAWQRRGDIQRGVNQQIARRAANRHMEALPRFSSQQQQPELTYDRREKAGWLTTHSTIEEMGPHRLDL